VTLRDKKAQAMSNYTVQVQPPILNWSKPQEPILWHWAVEARSQAEALAIVERGYCKGMPANIVPPLGMACRADLRCRLFDDCTRRVVRPQKILRRRRRRREIPPNYL